MSLKIYSKIGDGGETSLLSGRKVSKADIKIDSYGNIDELNSWVGLMGDYTINASRVNFIREIQNNLFVIGSHLADDPEKPSKNLPEFSEQAILDLEKAIDEYQKVLPPLNSFILPGGNKEVSFAHVARTVCRRAERGVVLLMNVEKINPNFQIYLNRLSDYLFVLARLMAHEMGATEIKWNPK